MAGWGRLGQNTTTHKLHEVKLEIQKDEQCISLYKTYHKATQICVGDPRKNQSTFSVRSPALSSGTPKPGGDLKQWELARAQCPQPFHQPSLWSCLPGGDERLSNSH